MEIETNISIEIDEDDWCAEIDLDDRIANEVKHIIESKVDDAVFEAMEEVRRSMGQATITPDRVREIVREIALVDGYAQHGCALTDDRTREIVREEITKSINGVGSVLAAMIGPKDSIKAVIGEPIPANQAWNTNKENSND